MSVKTYRLKPVEVKAIRYTPDTVAECLEFLKNVKAKHSITFNKQGESEIKVFPSRYNTRTLHYGDYIVYDEDGQCYAFSYHEFGLLYESTEKYGDMFIEIISSITNDYYAINIEDIKDIKRDGKKFGTTIIETKFGYITAKETPEEILKKIANAGVQNKGIR